MLFKDQEVRTSIEIDRSARETWHVFTDFASFPYWNPFIPRIFGAARIGQVVLEFVYIADGIFAPLPMEIVVCDEARELTWRGAVPTIMAALSYGHHRFLFDELDEDRCRFTHHAVLRGLFMQLGSNHIATKVRGVHEQMNEALKLRAETLISARRSSIVPAAVRNR